MHHAPTPAGAATPARHPGVRRVPECTCSATDVGPAGWSGPGGVARCVHLNDAGRRTPNRSDKVDHWSAAK